MYQVRKCICLQYMYSVLYQDFMNDTDITLDVVGKEEFTRC